METRNLPFIKLSDNDISEIEPIVERLNGLEELLMIVSESDEDLRNRIKNEIIKLKEDKDKWIQKFSIQKDFQYNSCKGYEINLLDKNISLYNQ